MSTQFKKGFSLTEVLMAAGILVIGFMMIAMVYPVGIKLAASATERTIGLVVAKEAQAKLKIYADHPYTIDFAKFRKDPNEILPDVMLFEDITGDETEFVMKIKEEDLIDDDPDSEYYWVDEMIYPSLDYYDRDISIDDSKYHWTAMCGDTRNGRYVEILILVTRKTGNRASFPVPEWDYTRHYYGYPVLPTRNMSNYPYLSLDQEPGSRPLPVRVDLYKIDQWNWWFDTDLTPVNFISKGSVVIDAFYNPVEGIKFYSVIDKIKSNEIELDGEITDTSFAADSVVTVWVVPPAKGSSRSPLVGVYPAGTIKFN
jgi:prepilin-type N-terminal cleavage/methylation domain-containing protein